MTTLNKPLHRVTRDAYSVLYAKPRRIVITLLPGDVIEFREHGCRQRYLLAVDTAFRTAVRSQINRDIAEKRAAKKKGSHGR